VQHLVESPNTKSREQQMPKSFVSLQHLTSRPLNDDPGHWIAYWQAQGQPWRKEPEIGDERQCYLVDCIKSIVIPTTPKRLIVSIKLRQSDIE
jgi:hypothetical protein